MCCGDGRAIDSGLLQKRVKEETAICRRINEYPRKKCRRAYALPVWPEAKVESWSRDGGREQKWRMA